MSLAFWKKPTKKRPGAAQLLQQAKNEMRVWETRKEHLEDCIDACNDRIMRFKREYKRAPPHKRKHIGNEALALERTLRRYERDLQCCHDTLYNLDAATNIFNTTHVTRRTNNTLSLLREALQENSDGVSDAVNAEEENMQMEQTLAMHEDMQTAHSTPYELSSHTADEDEVDERLESLFGRFDDSEEYEEEDFVDESTSPMEIMHTRGALGSSRSSSSNRIRSSATRMDNTSSYRPTSTRYPSPPSSPPPPPSPPSPMVNVNNNVGGGGGARRSAAPASRRRDEPPSSLAAVDDYL